MALKPRYIPAIPGAIGSVVTKDWCIMHQSFVTTVPPSPTGNSRDNDFSSIKAVHCGDLLRVIALLLIIVNSTQNASLGM